jgi:putative transposase
MPSPTRIAAVWRRLEGLLPPTRRTGRPLAHERRLVWEAMVYVMHHDCTSRIFPARLPPWQTVYAQFSQWRRTGRWETIWAGREQPYAPG